MRKKHIQNILKGGLFTLACTLAACGEDSSSQPQNDTPLSSSDTPGIVDTTTVPQSSNSATAPEPGLSSNAELTEQSSSSEQQTTTPDQPLLLSFEEEMVRDSLFVEASRDTGFSTIESVYQNLAEGERVVFLIRHAKRITNTSKEATLVYAGKIQAQTVGQKLATGESFAYGHTDFVRTQETAENIALGRGEEFPGSIVIPELTENWYIKDSEKLATYDTLNDPYLIYSQWAYEGLYADAFYDLKERCVRAITEIIVPQMSTTARVNIFVSHDMFIGPLTVYCTKGEVKRLRYWETDMWVYFVSGIAIIVKPNGERRYIPIDGIPYDT